MSDIKQRINGPAWAMEYLAIIFAVLGLALILFINWIIDLPHEAYADKNLRPKAQDTPWVRIGLGIHLMVSVFVVISAEHMKRLQGYSLAMGACIITALIYPCFGLPVAIWGIVLLRKPEVRSAFVPSAIMTHQSTSAVANYIRTAFASISINPEPIMSSVQNSGITPEEGPTDDQQTQDIQLPIDQNDGTSSEKDPLALAPANFFNAVDPDKYWRGKKWTHSVLATLFAILFCLTGWLTGEYFIPLPPKTSFDGPEIVKKRIQDSKLSTANKKWIAQKIHEHGIVAGLSDNKASWDYYISTARKAFWFLLASWLLKTFAQLFVSNLRLASVVSEKTVLTRAMKDLLQTGVMKETERDYLFRAIFSPSYVGSEKIDLPKIPDRIQTLIQRTPPK